MTGNLKRHVSGIKTAWFIKWNSIEIFIGPKQIDEAETLINGVMNVLRLRGNRLMKLLHYEVVGCIVFALLNATVWPANL